MRIFWKRPSLRTSRWSVLEQTVRFLTFRVLQKLLPSIILLPALFLIHTDLALADPSGRHQVVKLSSKVSNSCGSGVLLDHSILLTTAHVAEVLCNDKTCPKLLVSFSASNEQLQKEYESPNLFTLVSSLDLALIQLSPDSFSLGDVNFRAATTSQDSEIFVSGFPNCERLTTTEGKITSTDTLHWVTSAKGEPGSSGSGVFDTDGQLIGIVDEAATLSGRISHEFFGSSFSLKFIPLTAIQDVLVADKLKSIVGEASILGEFYREEVITKHGWSRLWASDRFLSLVEKLRVRAAQELSDSTSQNLLGSLLLSSGYTGRDLLPLLRRSDRLPEPIVALIFYSILESNGLHSSLMHPIKNSTIEALLSTSGIAEPMKGQLIKALSEFSETRYPGYNLMVLTTSITCGLLLIILGALWGASIGYVWRDLADVPSLLFRVWMMLVVGFAVWPLSFLIYILREQNRKRRIGNRDAGAPSKSPSFS